MADAIIYCDRCGRIVLPSEAASGEALVSATFAVCRACTRNLSAEERRAIEAMRAPGEATSAPPSPVQKGSVSRVSGPHPELARRPTRGAPVAILFGVGLGTGMLVAVAAVVLMRSRAPRGRTGLPTPPASIMAVTPREPPAATPIPVPPRALQETREPPQPREAPARVFASPAQARLAALRDLADPGLSRYDELRAEGAKFLAEFADTPEAESARELLREAESRYVEQAEGALKAALGAAETFLGQGRYDEAVRAFGYVRMRFGASDWFRQKAEPAIAEFQKRIESAKTGFAASGATVTEDFSKFAEGPFSAPAWTATGGWKVAGGALVGESQGQAVAALTVPEGSTLTFEATVTPRARAGPGWAASGIALYRDDANFWALALVEASDGPRYLELNEMLDGKWMAQLGEARLTQLESRVSGLTYDHRYRFRLELTPDGIAGSVRDLDGQDQGRVAYKFDNRAVKSGRPALRVLACRAEFDDVSVTVGGPAAAAAAAAPRTPEPGQEYSSGLLGEYFDGMNLDPGSLKARRIDPDVAFAWGELAPAEGVPADGFSARWTGELFVPSDGSYTFSLRHDDGARLWVEGRLVADGWGGPAESTSGRVELKAGWVPIRIEYFDNIRNAHVALSWSGPGFGRTPIPQRSLRTPGGPAVAAPPAPPPPPRGLPPSAREFGGRWYAYIPEPGNWQFAKWRCEEMGGHLVTIASREENEFVGKLLGNSAWIGLTDEGHEGRWEWVTGEKSMFTAWTGGEPSGGDENYVEMRAISPPATSWNDLKGDANVPGFVCEWEPEVLRLASPADARARPDTDGYWLDLSVLANLSRRRDATRPVAKKLAAIGGVLATSAVFDQVLKKELPPQEGYSLASKTGIASAGLVLGAARKAVGKALERERPEVVRICFDAGALRDGRGQAAWRADLAGIVEEVLEAGAVPVLFTMSAPRQQDLRALELVEGFNKAVREVASESLVPWVDAYGLMNADPAASFGRDGTIKAAAVQAIAEKFVRLYRILERAVMAREVSAADAGPAPPAPRAAPTRREGVRRVEEGLLALWLFSEGSGQVVRDRSGAVPPVDLRARDAGKLRWLAPQGGLELSGPTTLASDTDASRLAERVKATGRLSVEAWFEPANMSQVGPARIVSLSRDTMNRDFTLGQVGLELVFRLRTSRTGPNGEPPLQTKGLALPGGPVHAVATFDGTRVRLYVNGREREERHEPGGDLSAWQAFPIVVGNELTGDRPWLGRIYLVAIYDRALSAEEVLQNHAAGPRPGGAS